LTILPIYSIFDQINAALMSTRDLFQKLLKGICSELFFI